MRGARKQEPDGPAGPLDAVPGGAPTHWETIRKDTTSVVPPCLADYDRVCSDFTWAQARTEPAGLPGGGLNMAHEGVDLHAAAAHADRAALRCVARDDSVSPGGHGLPGERVVAGDHDDPDAGPAAGGNRVGDLRARRVQHADQSQERESRPERSRTAGGRRLDPASAEWPLRTEWREAGGEAIHVPRQRFRSPRRLPPGRVTS